MTCFAYAGQPPQLFYWREMRLQVYMEDAPSMIKKIFGEQARFLDFLIVRKLSSAKSKQLRGSLETHLGKR